MKAGWVVTDQKIDLELEKFRDHHLGKGSVKEDWDAAWRYWWRNGYHKCPLRPQEGPVLSLEAEVQRLADSQNGRVLLDELGPEEGMRNLRDLVAKSREGRPQ